jgi:hypothetical protein
MINTNTGVILPYNPDVIALGNVHIKECTADGVIIGKGNTEIDELNAHIGELQMIVDEKNRRIAALESYIAALEEEKNSAADVSLRRKLEELSLEDLRKAAAECGVSAKGTKAELIAGIVAKGNKNDLISAIVNKGKHEL